MRKILLSVVCGFAIVAAPNVGAARAQQSGTPLSPQSTQPARATMPSIDGRTNESEDPSTAVRQAQIARLQNNERQRRIVTDTDKLLKLATELKEDVDKSNKDQMSLEVIRKADEVERLAHDVKMRMRG